VSALIVRVHTAPVPTLVAVSGELDLLTAPQFRDELGVVPDGDVVLDLSGVRLLAAAGLSVLLDLQDRQARVGAQVVLAAAPPLARRVLCMTGLEGNLPMIATIEEAVAFVAGAAARARSADARPADGQCRVPTHTSTPPTPAGLAGKHELRSASVRARPEGRSRSDWAASRSPSGMKRGGLGTAAS
jgi:anti-anti-sigma factor